MVGRLHRENLLQTRFEASLVDEHSRTGRETAVSSSADVEALRQLSSTLTRDSVRIGPTSRTHNRCLPHIERFSIESGRFELAHHTMQYLCYCYTTWIRRMNYTRRGA